MARPKRPPHPILAIARTHVRVLAPELAEGVLHLHHLDGPANAPRYAVSVSVCSSPQACPYGVTDPDACPIFACACRQSLRFLLNRDGELVQAITDELEWDK